MSAKELAYRLISQVEHLNFKVQQPDAVQYLFDGFKTDFLIDADNRSYKKITYICARTAVSAAKRRNEKFRSLFDEQIVFLTDFVPAFEYISELSIPRNRFRFPAEDSQVFTTEISQLIRQSCPWC